MIRNTPHTYRKVGRPKILSRRIQTSINLSPEHFEALDELKDGISSNSEIIRLLIEGATTDKKYLKLFQETIELKGKVRECDAEIDLLKKEIDLLKKPTPQAATAEIDKDYLKELKITFKKYCKKVEPDKDLQLNFLRNRARDLGIPVLKLHKMVTP